MNEQAEPTEGERQAAATRARMAEDEQLALDEAIAILGTGASGYAMWVESDRSELLPPRITYCRADGVEGWFPKPAPNDERLVPPYSLGFSNPLTGEVYYPFRWQLGFAYIGAPGATYKPKTAQQLANMRLNRERRAIEALAADLPLLANIVRAGELPTTTKNALRNKQHAAALPYMGSQERAPQQTNAATQTDLFQP